METVNLMEQISIDIDSLISNRLPELGRTTLGLLPMKQRFFEAAAMLAGAVPPSEIRRRVSVEGDTVRAIGAVAIGAFAPVPATERLAMLRPFANDAHFGVREWSWIALREREGDRIVDLIDELGLWAGSDSQNIRRFASEVTRPRGVWCRHVRSLQANPEEARLLLDLLMGDEARYVQLSVGNWLNDARRTRPDWVESYCSEWIDRTGSEATSAICRRALRRPDPRPP